MDRTKYGSQKMRCSTSEMRRIILDMYETYPPKTIAELTGRSVQYIRCVASAMGIKSGGRGKDFSDYWTRAEEKMLQDCFGRSMTAAQLAMHLGRTKEAVMTKASRLGLGRRRFQRWLESEDAIIIEHYAESGASAVCRKLWTQRTTNAVKKRAAKLGIRIYKKSHPWKEDNLIMNEPN